MTKQEAFDTAVRGLASQGFTRCVTPDGTKCLYNSPDGTKHCAFGWLITDLALSEENNSQSVWDLFRERAFKDLKIAERFEGEDKENSGFYTQLQACHDSARKYTFEATLDDPEKMKSNLRGFALQYNLSTKVLDEVTATAPGASS